MLTSQLHTTVHLKVSNSNNTHPSSGDPPAMCQEAAADVTWAVTTRCGAGHALCLARLPRELDAIQVAVLLSLGCYGASWCASVGCVLPCHMSLTIAARDWTPGETERDVLRGDMINSVLHYHCLTHAWFICFIQTSKLITSSPLNDLLKAICSLQCVCLPNT